MTAFATCFKPCSNALADVHFHIRLDAAGQYAANLEAFLRQLPFPKTISIGEPARNQQLSQGHLSQTQGRPCRKSLCRSLRPGRAAHGHTQPLPDALVHLREIVARLEGQTRQSTRLANQLHNLLARVFPELGRSSPRRAGRAGFCTCCTPIPRPAELAAAPARVLDSHPYFT